MPELSLEAIVVVLVGQDLVQVKALPTSQTDDTGVVQGGQVIATVVIVVHEFLSSLHLSLYTCLFVGFAPGLFLFFGVRGVCDLGFSQATSTQIPVDSVVLVSVFSCVSSSGMYS